MIIRFLHWSLTIKLSLTTPCGLLGWEMAMPSFVEVSVYEEELDTISVRCSVICSENLNMNIKGINRG